LDMKSRLVDDDFPFPFRKEYKGEQLLNLKLL